MRKRNVVMLLTLSMAMTAMGAKIVGTTTLKDLQPTGTSDKKTHKRQQFDLFFDAQGMRYTCRTADNKSTNASDFVVGSELQYQVSGDKGKLRTADGKHVDCKIVRVESTNLTRP